VLRKKILLVDDSSVILMMERFIFRHEPVDLITATDGPEAIVKAIGERPDLILLDLNMPSLSGVEVCRRIHRLDPTKDIPVIMVLSRGEMLPKDVCCSEFLTKPINAVELLLKVRHYLGLTPAAASDTAARGIK
jgi:two-component system, OmpR family, alkaline phosphatase synthesis response regulator PhoP